MIYQKFHSGKVAWEPSLFVALCSDIVYINPKHLTVLYGIQFDKNSDRYNVFYTGRSLKIYLSPVASSKSV